MDTRTDDDSNSDDALMRRLLAPLGRRQAPDDAAMRRAEQAFRSALAPVVLRRKRTRRRAWLSLAATIVVAVGVGALFTMQQSNRAEGAIASLVKANGAVELLDDVAPLHPPAAIRTGQTLMTGATGRAALRYRGADVRLDVATTVRFDPARLVLERGAIYVDTGDAASRSEPPVVIETRFGVLGHTGTQFTARLDADRLTVGVREGTVYVDSGSERRDMSASPHRASVAEVGASGDIRTHEGAPYDNLWSWVSAASPGYTVENGSVDAYLAWLGHEHGYSVQYDGPDTATQATTTLLHGNPGDLPIEDAIAVINATTQLAVELDPTGIIRVALERDHHADPRHDGQ
jgi:ferric-dicitrate binding protein FerR (iron transport regulator)